MQLKKLEKKAAGVVWPKTSDDLPVITWEQFQEAHKTSGRELIVIGGCESQSDPAAYCLRLIKSPPFFR